ncbi:GRAM domain-containing protein [Gongronella butleri]|nr:GRAM domain-containing protein [Gongronella butleri]
MDEPTTPLPSHASEPPVSSSDSPAAYGSSSGFPTAYQELEKSLTTSTCTLSHDGFESTLSLPENCTHSSSKDNAYFHSLFKSVPEEDHLLDWYKCALHRDILLQGHLYVSERHVCFHSNIFGWVTNLVIQYSEITAIERRMTAMVIPNGIQINTQHAKHTFASFIYREAAYMQLIALWERHQQPTSTPQAALDDSWDSEASSGTDSDDEDEDEDELDEDDDENDDLHANGHVAVVGAPNGTLGGASLMPATSQGKPSARRVPNDIHVTNKKRARRHKRSKSATSARSASVSPSLPSSSSSSGAMWHKVAWKPVVLAFLILHTLWMLRQWAKMEQSWQSQLTSPPKHNFHHGDADDDGFIASLYDQSQHHRMYQRLEQLRQRMDDLNRQILDQQWQLYDLSPTPPLDDDSQ